MVVVDGIRVVVTDRSKGRTNVEFNSSKKSILLSFPCTNSSFCTPYTVYLPTGIYRFELWGAQGGYSRFGNNKTINLYSSGKGAYAAGTLKILAESRLYFYVGGMGENQTSIHSDMSLGGFNGGGNGGVDTADDIYPESSSGGGGSSDIRLLKGNSLSALKSRIIVAAGGGGSPSSGAYRAGDGGTISGTSASKYAIPGNQTYGVFGKGEDGHSFGKDIYSSGGSTGGSGGGYYGGTTSYPEPKSVGYFEAGAAGGSSYISGYEGCDSVNFDTADQPTHSGSPVHYTKRVFEDPVMMMKGNTSFVDQYGNREDGHYGNGAIKITIIERFGSVGPLNTYACQRRQSIPYTHSVIFLLYYSY